MKIHPTYPWLSLLLLWCVLLGVACSPEDAVTRLTIEAETRESEGLPQPQPFATTLVTRLQHCTLNAAIEALAEQRPQRRAAGALCAASVMPCGTLNPALSALTTDTNFVAQYTNRGHRLQ